MSVQLFFTEPVKPFPQSTNDVTTTKKFLHRMCNAMLRQNFDLEKLSHHRHAPQCKFCAMQHEHQDCEKRTHCVELGVINEYSPYKSGHHSDQVCRLF